MKLLVTRPSPDVEHTAARLRAAGHEVIVQPLLRPAFLPLATEVDPAALVVTSRNGVRAMVAWPASEGWRDLPLFAVGEATAAAAQRAGFTDVRSADGDGAALAALIAAARDPADGRLLYAAAAGRSPVLEQLLGEAGFAVDVAIAYRMIPAVSFDPGVLAALENGAVEGLLLYSRRSADAFLALAEGAVSQAFLSGLRIFALSPAVAAAFAGRDVGRIDVAASPREDALFRLIPTAR